MSTQTRLDQGTQLALLEAPVAEEWIYLGVTACGCIVAAQMDDPLSKDRTRQRQIDAAVAAMVRDGLTVQHRRLTDGPLEIGRKVGCCRPGPQSTAPTNYTEANR